VDKDIYKRINEIEAEMSRLTSIIGSSGENLPSVATDPLDDTTTIVCESDNTKYIHRERGSEKVLLETNDLTELMVRLRYSIIAPVLEERYKIKNQNGILEKFKKHRELYMLLGPEFVDAHDKQVAQTLKYIPDEEQ